MRRLLIVALLLAGMHLIRPLAAVEIAQEPLLVFGFLILAAYSIGELTAVLGLPRMVGYLAAGVLFGPDALGTVTRPAADALEPVTSLAIALIAFLAGAELRWPDLRAHGGALLKVLGSELLFTFAALATTIFALRSMPPFMSDIPIGEAIAFSLIFASIAAAHSPAATIAVLTETRARGDLTRTTLGIVLLSDIAIVLLFSIALGAGRIIAPPPGAAGASLWILLWEILGAFLIGGALGAAVATYLRFVGKELILFAVLVTFFGAEIASLAHVDPLLTLLVAGFVTQNGPRDGVAADLLHAMERAAAPVFVVFFALAGVAIDIDVVISVAPVAIPLVVVRIGAIWSGCRIGARAAKLDPAIGHRVWLGLVAQAGVAIGLANVVAEAYPAAGSGLRTLLLALIAINQIIGPVLFRRALVTAGEVPSIQSRSVTRSPALQAE